MNTLPVYFIAYIFEAFIAYFYFQHVFIPKRKNGDAVFCVICFYEILILISIFNNTNFNLIAFALCNFLIIILCYSTSCKVALLHTAVLTSFVTSTEIAVSLVISRAFGISCDASDFSNPAMLTGYIISKLIYLFLILIAVRFNRKKQGKAFFNVPFQLICIMVISIFLLFTINHVIANYILSASAYILLIAASVCIIYVNLLVFWLQEYIPQRQVEVFEKTLQAQQESISHEYFSLLKEQYDNQKIIIHDIRNHLQVIYNMCEEDKNEKVLEYVQKIIKLPSISHPVSPTPCHKLNLILGIYISRCEQANIAFYIDCPDIDLDFVSTYDITALFCNLLDNALASAKKAEKAFIALTIRQKPETNQTIIKIKNSCVAAPEMDVQGNLITSKSNDDYHGIGQFSIRNTIRKYNGHIEYSYDDSDMTFHSIVLLYSRRATDENSNLR